MIRHSPSPFHLKMKTFNSLSSFFTSSPQGVSGRVCAKNADLQRGKDNFESFYGYFENEVRKKIADGPGLPPFFNPTSGREQHSQS